MSITVYAEPWRHIAVAEGHARFAEFEARILAATTRCTWLEVQTFDQMVAAFDALTEDERLNVVTNAENPWLAVITARQDATPSSSWHSGGQYASVVQAEFTRQGAGTVSGSTTMAQYKAVGIRCWQDCTTYAGENGCENHFHYASPGYAFSDGLVGVPRQGIRDSGTVRTYWEDLDGSYDDLATVVAATHDANGALPDIMDAHDGCAADAVGFYSFVPDGTQWSDAISKWTALTGASSLPRKNPAGVTQTPPFEATDLQSWIRFNYGALTHNYRTARDAVADADPDYAAAAARPMAVVLTPSPSGAGTGLADFIRRNHWQGLVTTDTDTVAQNLVGGFFLDSDADTTVGDIPEVIHWWDNIRYYRITFPTNQRDHASTSADDKIRMDQERHAIEKLFLGRPHWEDGDPTGNAPAGGTDWSEHDDFFEAKNLGDPVWYRANGSFVMRNASGVVHPTLVAAGLTVDFTEGGATELLAPHFSAAQVAGSAAITADDFVDAMELYYSEWSVSIFEAAAEIIAARTPGGEPMTDNAVVVKKQFVNKLLSGQVDTIADLNDRAQSVAESLAANDDGLLGGTW